MRIDRDELLAELPKRRSGVSERASGFNEALDAVVGALLKPEPMELDCPRCRKQHVDRGVWAMKSHRTHLCEHCGFEWKPRFYATVGVEPKNSAAQLAGAPGSSDREVLSSCSESDEPHCVECGHPLDRNCK